MKNLKKHIVTIVSIAILTTNLSSCNSAVVRQQTQGNELFLPPELKGLKVYWVGFEGSGGVYVAVLDDKVNSTQSSNGKTNTSTIILNKQNGNLIEVSEIISENDSIIVCKK